MASNLQRNYHRDRADSGNKREDVAGFGAKSEQFARSMSSTAIERLGNRSTGGLQRSVVVNSDGKSRYFWGLGSATRSRVMLERVVSPFGQTTLCHQIEQVPEGGIATQGLAGGYPRAGIDELTGAFVDAQFHNRHAPLAKIERGESRCVVDLVSD